MSWPMCSASLKSFAICKGVILKLKPYLVGEQPLDQLSADETTLIALKSEAPVFDVHLALGFVGYLFDVYFVLVRFVHCCKEC